MIAKGGEKVENDNPADCYNTVLKMAKKRALVDAVLTATAASDIFTQDLEDISANIVAKTPGRARCAGWPQWPPAASAAPKQPVAEVAPTVEVEEFDDGRGSACSRPRRRTWISARPAFTSARTVA